MIRDSAQRSPPVIFGPAVPPSCTVADASRPRRHPRSCQHVWHPKQSRLATAAALGFFSAERSSPSDPGAFTGKKTGASFSERSLLDRRTDVHELLCGRFQHRCFSAKILFGTRQKLLARSCRAFLLNGRPITACQGCASARICPHCAALVEPSAEIHLPGLRVGRLSPKVDTLALQFLFWSVRALHFSDRSTALRSGEWGRRGRG
jgi:hypothetical protein